MAETDVVPMLARIDLFAGLSGRQLKQLASFKAPLVRLVPALVMPGDILVTQNRAEPSPWTAPALPVAPSEVNVRLTHHRER